MSHESYRNGQPNCSVRQHDQPKLWRQEAFERWVVVICLKSKEDDSVDHDSPMETKTQTEQGHELGDTASTSISKRFSIANILDTYRME
jgi:hypothetical protein